MLIDIVSVFPEYFNVLNLSLLGKAQDKGLLEFKVHNLRDWTHDVHHSVDDTPVGGGAGMVMKPEIWANCLDDLLSIPPLTDIRDADSERGKNSNAILQHLPLLKKMLQNFLTQIISSLDAVDMKVMMVVCQNTTKPKDLTFVSTLSATTYSTVEK